MTTPPISAVPPDLDRLRARTVRSLVASVALGSTGHIASVTIASLVAQDLLGGSALAGAPGAAIVLGASLGAALLAGIMVRRGRRAGLVAGYGLATIGALLAIASIGLRMFPLLLAGTLLLGFGNSSNQLSRYTAADLFPPRRRASAIGIVVWAATVGAVVGPNLPGIAGQAATMIGLPELAGGYLVPLVFGSLAGLLLLALLRPDPYQLADVSSLGSTDDPAAAPFRDVIRRPPVAVGIVVLIVGQFVMTLIMTMTPVHMRDHGHSLAAIGIVLSGHTLGMFALSPISGRLTDRFGSTPVIYGGTAILAASGLMAAVAPPDGGLVLLAALFLLGWGWNLGFVAGSALLSGGLSLAERTRIQGATDSLIWGTAAIASLGSGVVLATAGFTTLGLLGAALVIAPVWVLTTRRSRLAVVAATLSD